MTRSTAGTAVTAGVRNLEAEIRARIESLSYLPTTAAVAMKFVELGKYIDADPADYARVIGAESVGMLFTGLVATSPDKRLPPSADRKISRLADSLTN